MSVNLPVFQAIRIISLADLDIFRRWISTWKISSKTKKSIHLFQQRKAYFKILPNSSRVYFSFFLSPINQTNSWKRNKSSTQTTLRELKLVLQGVLVHNFYCLSFFFPFADNFFFKKIARFTWEKKIDWTLKNLQAFLWWGNWEEWREWCIASPSMRRVSRKCMTSKSLLHQCIV